MSVELIINGTSYFYPEVDDVQWGNEATDWAVAVTGGMLQKSGGLFQLLADVDFGTNFGLKSLYYSTRTADPADAGIVRLAQADSIAWRNAANNGNLLLGVNGSDELVFDGTPVLPSTLPDGDIWIGNASNVAAPVTVSGDITISNAGVTAIGANKVLNTMLAQMATLTIKGNNTGGTADPLDLTATQVTAMLDNFVGDSGLGGTKGLVPAPAAGDAAAGRFLSADGTWAAPAGAGDVVGPASATNNGFVKFDGTTGKLIKDSPATISNADVDASAAIALSKLASLTASRAVVTDGSGVLTVATTTATEIGYVNGVTSAIQTQIDSKTTVPLVESKTTTFTAVVNAVYLCDSSGGTYTATLPSASGNSGQSITFKKTTSDVTAITIGAVTAIHTQNETVTLISDGSNWNVIDRVIPSVWASFTPTGSFSTNATFTGRWKRNGDSVQFAVTVTFTGGTDAGGLFFNIPFSWTIDTAKMSTTNTTWVPVGLATMIVNGGVAAYGYRVNTQSSTSVNLRFDTTNGGTNPVIVNNSGTVSNINPLTIANNDSISVMFEVPITGLNG